MDHLATNNSSLSIVTCPVCHRAITVYMDTGMDVEMKCPLCKKRYLFEKVVTGLPPMIEFADESDDSSSNISLAPEKKKFSFDEIPAPAPIRRPGSKGRRGGSESRGTSKSGSGKSDSSSRSSSSRSSGSRSGSKNSRSSSSRSKAFSKSNPVRETILFIIGGLLALPVGQLIIWWAIGKDPLSLGPMTSNVAPFAVPAQFHAKEEAEDGELVDETAAAGDNDSGLPESQLGKKKPELTFPKMEKKPLLDINVVVPDDSSGLIDNSSDKKTKDK